MLINCPECTGKVSDVALACPHCGFPIQTIKISTTKEKTLKKANTKPRNKYKKLPNGFGSIQKLSGNRRNPYAAYPPTEEFSLTGSPIRQKAIGYYDSWHRAFDALSDYNKLNEKQKEMFDSDRAKRQLTFSQVYEMYYKFKFRKEIEAGEKKSSMQQCIIAAFKNSSALHDRIFSNIYTEDMQNVVDACALKYSSKEFIVTLFKQMSKYAMANNIIDKDYSMYVKIEENDDDVKGEPFTENDIAILWKHKDDCVVQKILIMIYTGFRIKAFETIKTNLDEQYFLGGVKTKAGKDRIVPIHPGIKDFVKEDTFVGFKAQNFRTTYFYPKLKELGIEIAKNGEKHTPHDTRHTFSWLCDKYNVNDTTKHILMGHSMVGDVEKSVYTHRTIEDLSIEIRKIKIS